MWNLVARVHRKMLFFFFYNNVDKVGSLRKFSARLNYFYDILHMVHMGISSREAIIGGHGRVSLPDRCLLYFFFICLKRGEDYILKCYYKV